MIDKKGMEMTVFDTYLNLQKYLGNHECICVSVSGGADSDVIVHMIATQFREHLHKIHFVFSNTGIEYKATLRHLDDLEEKYGIKIDRVKGTPIPIVVKKYGVPFLSKQVSEFIYRLQKHGFTWKQGDLESLESVFENCRAALRWWCNDWGTKSRFNINWNRDLDTFLQKNPPAMPISAICCQKSKKDPLINHERSIGCDLTITGERKSEGGARASKTGCFEKSHGFDHYMPLFHWDDATKEWYVRKEGIIHSDCYVVYGLKRTGCVGCPYAKNRKEELEIMQKFEPKLYKMCMAVFGKSYEMLDQYEAYMVKQKTNKEEMQNVFNKTPEAGQDLSAPDSERTVPSERAHA